MDPSPSLDGQQARAAELDRLVAHLGHADRLLEEHHGNHLHNCASSPPRRTFLHSKVRVDALVGPNGQRRLSLVALWRCASAGPPCAVPVEAPDMEVLAGCCRQCDRRGRRVTTAALLGVRQVGAGTDDDCARRERCRRARRRGSLERGQMLLRRWIHR